MSGVQELDIDITETSTTTERRAISCTVEFETLGYRAYVQMSDECRLPGRFEGPRLSVQVGNMGMYPTDWMRLVVAVETVMRLYENRWPTQSVNP